MPRKPPAPLLPAPGPKKPRGVGLGAIDTARVEWIQARLPEGTSFNAAVRDAIRARAVELGWPGPKA